MQWPCMDKMKQCSRTIFAPDNFTPYSLWVVLHMHLLPQQYFRRIWSSGSGRHPATLSGFPGRSTLDREADRGVWWRSYGQSSLVLINSTWIFLQQPKQPVVIEVVLIPVVEDFQSPKEKHSFAVLIAKVKRASYLFLYSSRLSLPLSSKMCMMLSNYWKMVRLKDIQVGVFSKTMLRHASGERYSALSTTSFPSEQACSLRFQLYKFLLNIREGWVLKTEKTEGFVKRLSTAMTSIFLSSDLYAK